MTNDVSASSGVSFNDLGPVPSFKVNSPVSFAHNHFRPLADGCGSYGFKHW